MQFFVVFTPKKRFAVVGVPDDFAKLLPLEEARAKELYVGGVLRQSWVLGKREKGAACLFEVRSPAHLQEALDSFPLIQNSYSDYEVFPLAPDPVFARPSWIRSMLS